MTLDSDKEYWLGLLGLMLGYMLKEGWKKEPLQIDRTKENSSFDLVAVLTQFEFLKIALQAFMMPCLISSQV